ncbi:UDP:flavonoid glycosyltransferase YjiC (YdhE family) [Saccharopolyspora dendranthemae]|uniref:UDP:flavonoid glycosyltransferase YjiC (YdhE family) n=1 Tax=Saccharopolyspora dendranthemae TaxID=1181886 RepID=A0A561VBQ9_9PSEU|nr:UDP:flavonoid glycosyltransferase YjiC (YdhE family) [Saccharopolyspora dendranthemae]
MRILFTAGPAHGLTLPIVPLVWAARAAGHEVLFASASEMVDVLSRAGLPVVDVFPDHERWDAVMGAAMSPAGPTPEQLAGVPEWMAETFAEVARTERGPFGSFTLAMTEGTIEAGRAFGAELVVHTSGHPAGGLTADALGVPVLEVGNRISWSSRDADSPFRVNEDVDRLLRDRLGIPGNGPEVIARIDPRPPSMGGLAADEPDAFDEVPWWPMRFVPFNGGSAVPDWALRRPDRPRVGVTLGTVVPLMSGTSTVMVALDALADMDVEVVLAGKIELGSVPDNVRAVGYLPLSVFLPTTSLLVHHGGSGTTAAPLHHGVPQLVLPSFADNPLSAERVVGRGVGLSHDPATVDADTVRATVCRLLDEPEFAECARAVAEEMASQPSPSDVLQRAVSRARME